SCSMSQGQPLSRSRSRDMIMRRSLISGVVIEGERSLGFHGVVPAKAGIHFAFLPWLAAGMLNGPSENFRALRESLLFERQRKATKRNPP
ncbi:MAG: hypothetical protein ABWZ08_14760, partial [Pseudoxanthomonas sp.]